MIFDYRSNQKTAGQRIKSYCSGKDEDLSCNCFVMGLKSLFYAAWLSGLVLQVLLLLAIAARSAWRRFPMFALYSAITFAENFVAYWLSADHSLYFYVYLIGETVSILLGVAVVFEIFEHLFAPHPALKKLASQVFRVVAVALFLLGGAVIYIHAPLGKAGFVTALMVLEEAARIVEVGLIMGLFLCSSAFGLHWRQQVFGVGLGLGSFIAVRLITIAMVARVPDSGAVLNLVLMLALNLSLLIWIGYLILPEPASSPSELPQRSQLEQWNQAVMELIRQ